MPKRAILASKCNYARGLFTKGTSMAASSSGPHLGLQIVNPEAFKTFEGRERYNEFLSQYPDLPPVQLFFGLAHNNEETADSIRLQYKTIKKILLKYKGNDSTLEVSKENTLVERVREIFRHFVGKSIALKAQGLSLNESHSFNSEDDLDPRKETFKTQIANLIDRKKWKEAGELIAQFSPNAEDLDTDTGFNVSTYYARQGDFKKTAQYLPASLKSKNNGPPISFTEIKNILQHYDDLEINVNISLLKSWIKHFRAPALHIDFIHNQQYFERFIPYQIFVSLKNLYLEEKNYLEYEINLREAIRHCYYPEDKQQLQSEFKDFIAKQYPDLSLINFMPVETTREFFRSLLHMHLNAILEKHTEVFEKWSEDEIAQAIQDIVAPLLPLSASLNACTDWPQSIIDAISAIIEELSIAENETLDNERRKSHIKLLRTALFSNPYSAVEYFHITEEILCLGLDMKSQFCDHEIFSILIEFSWSDKEAHFWFLFWLMNRADAGLWEEEIYKPITGTQRDVLISCQQAKSSPFTVLIKENSPLQIEKTEILPSQPEQTISFQKQEAIVKQEKLIQQTLSLFSLSNAVKTLTAGAAGWITAMVAQSILKRYAPTTASTTLSRISTFLKNHSFSFKISCAAFGVLIWGAKIFKDHRRA